ncbi:MarR family winged helix-turn-helix transcriptional regulator [Novispirillum itersonii]|uniref:DNA-binding MarR family transcriptional regulator n=1 Tax=Novispirillum itersonii TaxID=189 RepID=A0A7X0DKI6_NOVIT|nr:MarR family transcriptional regulator [Novispirillum itersonii]MBB6208981.1 DNA-binding MarR family transcriptional regulator [Novispirillum itersonii]
MFNEVTPVFDYSAADSDDALRSFVLEEQVGHLLRKANQRATAIFQSQPSLGDMTMPQFLTLVKLQEKGEVSQNSLGRLIGMDAATMQGVVRRLTERGWIVREADARDRRRVRLTLTEEGRGALTASLEAARRANDQTLAPLTPREQQTFMRLLKRIS